MLNNKLDQPCLLLATLKTSHINYETKKIKGYLEMLLFRDPIDK